MSDDKTNKDDSNMNNKAVSEKEADKSVFKKPERSLFAQTMENKEAEAAQQPTHDPAADEYLEKVLNQPIPPDLDEEEAPPVKTFDEILADAQNCTPTSFTQTLGVIQAATEANLPKALMGFLAKELKTRTGLGLTEFKEQVREYQRSSSKPEDLGDLAAMKTLRRYFKMNESVWRVQRRIAFETRSVYGKADIG